MGREYVKWSIDIRKDQFTCIIDCIHGTPKVSMGYGQVMWNVDIKSGSRSVNTDH